MEVKHGFIYGNKHSEITKKRIGEASRNRSSESNMKISQSMKGRTPWNKGKCNVYTKEQIEKMKQSALGRKHSEETKKKISQTQKGKTPWNKGLGKGPYQKKGTHKGFIWITKNNTAISKRIPKEELDSYIADEWHRGRDIIKGKSTWIKGKHLSEEQRTLVSKRTKEAMNTPEIKAKLKALKGKVAINDGVHRKYINREELNQYLNKGYTLGYPKKKGR